MRKTLWPNVVFSSHKQPPRIDILGSRLQEVQLYLFKEPFSDENKAKG